MRKTAILLLAISLFLAVACCALGEGITLRTTTTFVGTDLGAQAYVDLLAQWEAETGNIVYDESANSDEAWKASVLNDFAAGNEPDLLFFFARTSDSKLILDRVVPIAEINAAYPDLNLEESDLLREDDGNVYAISVRSFWEALFVNKDLFDQFGLALPTDVDKFEYAITVFKHNNIVPISISLSDIPHYIAELSILSSGSVEDHAVRPKTPAEIPQSWIRGMELCKYLYDLGAFSGNVNSTSNDLAVAAFAAKEAAMMLEGSWRANGISSERWDSTVVMPFPAYSPEANPVAVVGGTSMGFYITRRAWEDEARRDAAVSLLAKLTSPEAKQMLGYSFGGALLESSVAMFENAVVNDVMCDPIQDQMDTAARAYWFSMFPAMVEGTADPTEVLAETIRQGAF